MAVPEQVRKQSEAIEAFYTTMNAPQDGEPDVEVVEEPAANAVAEDQGNPVEQVAAPAVQEEDGSYEHRYRTLQGMYNAEVPRLHQQLKEQSGRIQQLEQLLATPQETGPSPEAQTPAQRKFVSDSEVEEYGQSIDVMRKVSKEELDPLLNEIATLRSQLSSLQTNVVPKVEHVAQRQTASAEQVFWAELNRAVPNWQEVNNSPDFQTWLLQHDPMIGNTRQVYLEQAQRDLDPARVASFFNTWQAMQSSAPAPTIGNGSRNSELERQVAPGRTRGGEPPAQSTAKEYSRADIQKFFDDVRRGVYRGKEEERSRIERDIFSAQRDGRITDA